MFHAVSAFSVPLLTWVSGALFSGHHLQLQELLPLYMMLITLCGSSGNQTEMTVVHVELYHFMSFILYATNTQGYTGTIRLCWSVGEIVVLPASLLMIVCRIQGTVFPEKFFSTELLRISYWLPFSTVSMLPMYCLASFLCSYFCTIWGTRHMDTCKTYTPSISSYHSTKSSHEHHGDAE